MFKKIFIIIIASACFNINTVWASNDYDYISINEPFLNKVPIAIPYFKGSNNSKEENFLNKKAHKILEDALSYTNFFNILNHNAFLEDIRDVGIKTSNVIFQNWTSIGAEYLISGGFYCKENKKNIGSKIRAKNF